MPPDRPPAVTLPHQRSAIVCRHVPGLSAFRHAPALSCPQTPAFAVTFFNRCVLGPLLSFSFCFFVVGDRPVRFRLANPTRCRPPRFNVSWSNFEKNNFGLYTGGAVYCCCCGFFPWSVAAELEQLGAPYVVFPDMIVGGFICLAICIFFFK